MTLTTTSSPDVAPGPAIEVRDLRKRYGDVQAVDGVTFDVQRGEVFGMLGPNGAGKTTTVEIMEGLRVPDTGEVRVLGLDATRETDALKERIGVQLQTAAWAAGSAGDWRAIASVCHRRVLPSSVAASSSRLWPVATTSNPPSTAARLNT